MVEQRTPFKSAHRGIVHGTLEGFFPNERENAALVLQERWTNSLIDPRHP